MSSAGTILSANQVAASEDAARQKKTDAQQLQLAPLSMALKADHDRLALYADPNDPSKAVAGHENEYNETLNRMADTIGKMRAAYGQKAPGEDPNPLASTGAHFLDKLHITRDLASRLATRQSDKVNGYYRQNNEMASEYAQGVPYNPLTPEEQAQAARVKAGLEPRAESKTNFKNFRGPNGEISTFDTNRPATIPPGWILAPNETGDTRLRGDFANDPNKKPGETFEQWKSRQAKTPNRDDKYLAILQKKQEGQSLTPEESAYENAYNLWTKETKIDPGVARAVAFGADRFVPVIDPQNPENVTFMRVSDAAKEHVGSPAGIAFQTDKALTRAFTSGQPAQTINYFNTATEHLKQLQQAADALQNGDIQLFNKYGNAWAAQTGSPAPTDFATIRNAVAGELSKTFKGAAATDAEIDAINTSINSSQSPAQLSGAIGNNIRLMGSKLDALRGQYEAGKQGKPNFPEANIPSRGKVSLKKAMAMPENKGKTQNQIKLEITGQGFEVIP